ncbi:MAG TPA: CPBP family intramembrane glutamic endopeptidase [Candidatus Eisenbacteria bacterium]|nr:CPBP family intramembrane glutamic endopeptidase [Candidatus Eisenbacteria bacterium]
MGLAAVVWARLPIILRAVIVGSFVMSMATVPCGSLLRVNFALAPSVPWSVPLVAIYLWLYWRYLRGEGWPQSTAEFRRTNLRAHSLPGRVWRWSLLAGGLGWASVLGLRIIIDSLFGLPRESLSSLSSYPFVMTLSYIVGASVLAGIAEEAGCRGYMQVPIERRHGSVVAILVVGVVFWLSHGAAFVGQWGLFLGHSWFYLAASAVFGTLAYLTGSILPGVLLHTVANLVGFGLIGWLGSSAGASSTNGDGFGLFLWTTGGAALVSLIATVWAYRRLAIVARSMRARAG